MITINQLDAIWKARFGVKVAHLCGWCDRKFTSRCNMCRSKVCEIHKIQMAPGIRCPDCHYWTDKPLPVRINFDGVLESLGIDVEELRDFTSFDKGIAP